MRQVVKEYVHDPNAFTQGLEYDTDCSSGTCQDVFWESTGAQQFSHSDLESEVFILVDCTLGQAKLDCTL